MWDEFVAPPISVRSRPYLFSIECLPKDSPRVHSMQSVICISFFLWKSFRFNLKSKFFYLEFFARTFSNSTLSNETNKTNWTEQVQPIEWSSTDWVKGTRSSHRFLSTTTTCFNYCFKVGHVSRPRPVTSVHMARPAMVPFCSMGVERVSSWTISLCGIFLWYGCYLV